jgi:phosphate transport system permease protein
VSARSRAATDRVLVWGQRASAALSAAVLVLIVVFVGWEAAPALGRLDLSWGGSWHPSEGRFGLAPMLVGTLLVAGGAVALAAPAGVASGVFCRFYAPPRVASVYRAIVELLGGIPSVVYGLWGLVVLVPLIARAAPPGASVLAGVLVLGLMILPTAALVSDAALGSVPPQLLASAAALGLSRWTTVRRVALPVARSGIRTGVVLGAGRALGETMAVLMVCGNVARIPGSPFDPARTLTANIALEMAYALGDHRAALFASGLLLLGVVSGLVGLARWLERGARDR